MATRKKYVKQREDYRKGGRVKLAYGGYSPYREMNGGGGGGGDFRDLTPKPKDPPEVDDDSPFDPDVTTPANPNDPNPTEPPPENIGTDPDWIAGNPTYAVRSEDQAQQSRDIVQGAAEGKLPKGAIVPKAQKAAYGIDARTAKMKDVGDSTGFTAELPVTEDVFTGDSDVIVDPEILKTATYGAVKADTATVQGAAGRARAIEAEEIRKLTERAQAAGYPTDEAMDKAKADRVIGVLSDKATADRQVGEGGKVADTPQAEAKAREAITGEAPKGDAAQIDGIPTFTSATRQQVKGAERSGAAATMIGEITGLPPAITAAVVEDPATVTAQIDAEPVEVQAAVAALPTEALVSSQMETLIAGIEEGATPAWARPAVSRVEEMLAQRGLGASTVGRDALFNAIIQTALPMAQNNAQALQQRAAQNLSNEQQANLEEARLDMTRRMTNVANRQTSESQSAQMAQQIAVQQGQFRQEAVMATAQIQQQTRMQNLQNQQEQARINAQQQQQMSLSNLANAQQIEVMDLQIESERLKDQMSAEQQGKLAVFQTAANFMAQNAAFTQDMNKANLSSEEKVNLANLQALNQAGAENLSAEMQTEMANLQSKMQVGITNANLANAMGISQLSADQAIAISNAQTVAGLDMSQFNVDQQTQLANSKFMQTTVLQDFNQRQQEAMQNATALASLDMAAVDQRTQLAITNAKSFLAMDMASLNNDQQARVVQAQLEQQAFLSDQSQENASRQFNATSVNQTRQFMSSMAAQIDINNATRNDAMAQFNANSRNAKEARESGIEADLNKANAALLTQVSQYNNQMDFNREQWNTANAQAVEQSNVEWRRKANLVNTAAQNAVNHQNAMNSFGLSTQAMTFLWQELRDQADYEFKHQENELTRKTQLLATAIGNEGAGGKDNWTTSLSPLLTSIMNGVYGSGTSTEPELCFMKGTMIDMADGSSKEISTLQLDDHTKGGIVEATMQGTSSTMYDYKGTKVTGNHAVKEDGLWTEVQNSKYGVLTDMVEPVYSLITSDHRIFIDGIEFGDYLIETEEQWKEYRESNSYNLNRGVQV